MRVQVKIKKRVEIKAVRVRDRVKIRKRIRNKVGDRERVRV